MDIESKRNWRLWCRLCTKDNATNISNILLKDEEKERVHESEVIHSGRLDESRTNKELVAAIEKYFSVNLQDNEDLPKSLCSECFTFVKTLLVFVDRVVKAQHLFLILQQTKEDIQFDSDTLRLKYGLTNEEVFSTQRQQPEVHFFDTKPETRDIQEEKVFEPEIIITDPLEVPKLRLRIKTEKVETDKVVINVTSVQEKFRKADDGDDNYNDDSTITQSLQKTNSEEEGSGDNSELDSKRKKENSKTKKLKKSKCPANDSIRSKECTAENFDNNTKTEKSPSEIDEIEILTCDVCSMKFKTIKVFRKHMKEVHKRDVPKYYTCPHCAREFQQPYKLRNHLLVHKPIESRRVVPCPHCDKKFTSSNMVEFHINYIHKDLRPFICEKCGETCRTNADLRCHILTHTDYAPFQCEVCNKRFKQRTRLKKHMPIHDPVKPICTVCGLQLSTRFTLKRHMLVHSSEMQHKCDYCGRAFKRSKTLKSHLLLHTGLKPYTCNFCDRTFANGSNCRTHKKRAHPEELAALEATGSTKINKLNIPKLKALKALTKSGENLLPVVSKQSGCFAKDHFEKRLSNETSTSTESKPKEDLQEGVQSSQYVNYMFMMPS